MSEQKDPELSTFKPEFHQEKWHQKLEAGNRANLFRVFWSACSQELCNCDHSTWITEPTKGENAFAEANNMSTTFSLMGINPQTNAASQDPIANKSAWTNGKWVLAKRILSIFTVLFCFIFWWLAHFISTHIYFHSYLFPLILLHNNKLSAFYLILQEWFSICIEK